MHLCTYLSTVWSTLHLCTYLSTYMQTCLDIFIHENTCVRARGRIENELVLPLFGQPVSHTCILMYKALMHGSQTPVAHTSILSHTPLSCRTHLYLTTCVPGLVTGDMTKEKTERDWNGASQLA